VTLAELAESSVVRTHWPLLAQAAGSAASPQIRNLGTVGGNLCQRPRCWYYRAENLVCLRKGGDKCLALEGDHRYHAIFGDGPCHNPNMASLAVPLLAYGARVEILGPKGPRTVPLESIYDPYGGNIRSDTNLAPDDVLQHVLLDAADGVHAAHEEVRPRHCQDWPLATASVVLRLNGPNVAAARVVLGAVATSPLLCAPAAAALMGRPPSAASAAAAAEAAVRDAKPLAQNAHKVTITRHLVRRVILAAAGLAQV
jgi:xanthine dehydrogenase YagS FAD-binding subunit